MTLGLWIILIVSVSVLLLMIIYESMKLRHNRPTLLGWMSLFGTGAAVFIGSVTGYSALSRLSESAVGLNSKYVLAGALEFAIPAWFAGAVIGLIAWAMRATIRATTLRRSRKSDDQVG